MVAPAGMVIPLNIQAFHTPAASQLANGLAVMLTTVATSLASSAEALTAIGPIVVAINKPPVLEHIQVIQTD